MMGTLLVSGIHPPPDCTEIPLGFVGLDNEVFSGSCSPYHEAKRVWEQWVWRCEDDIENSEVPPTVLSPYEFIRWCDDTEIETDWLRLFKDVIGVTPARGEVDFIPLAVALHAARTEQSVSAVLDKVSQLELVKPDQFAPVDPAKQKGASIAAVPMPVPPHREHLSTDEFAAVLAVEAQTVRKRHSETGTYHGVRPIKLPNRRLLWPVDAVRRLLNGELADE